MPSLLQILLLIILPSAVNSFLPPPLPQLSAHRPAAFFEEDLPTFAGDSSEVAHLSPSNSGQNAALMHGPIDGAVVKNDVEAPVASAVANKSKRRVLIKKVRSSVLACVARSGAAA